jgi:hypothetical protein
MHAAPLVSPRASTRRRRVIRLAVRLVGTGLGVAAAAYAGLVAHSWYRYGSPRPAVNADVDPLLDRFMPAYEVVERRRVPVRASAEITQAVARDQDLLASPVIRAIFTTRALVLGSRPDERARPHPLILQMLSLGWGVLADVPDREIVMGAVTRPWGTESEVSCN